MAKQDVETSALRLPHLGGHSLAEQARAEIMAAILDQRFKDKLPPEDQLAKELAISRTTVRAALNSLEREGVITRRRAVGTTINRHAIRSALFLQNLVGFDQLLRDQGHDVAVETQTRVGTPEPWIAENFGLDGTRQHLLTQKAYLAGGRLALHARDVIALDSLAVIPSGDDLPASVFEFCETHGVAPIDHAIAELSVGVTGRDQTRLELEAATPFMRVLETHFSKDAQVLAHSVIDVDDSLIRFEVFRRGTA